MQNLFLNFFQAYAKIFAIMTIISITNYNDFEINLNYNTYFFIIIS